MIARAPSTTDDEDDWLLRPVPPKFAEQLAERGARELKMPLERASRLAEDIERELIAARRPATLNDDVWAKFAKDFDLPDAAREDLVDIVRVRRLHSGTKPWKREPPSQAIRDLAKLCEHARALADGLPALRIRAGSALSAVWEEDRLLRLRQARLTRPGANLRPNNFIDFFETTVETTVRLAALLERAEGRVRRRGEADLDRQPVTRSVVAALDQFLIDHTGKGLVRASENSKKGGRATACKEFASRMLKHILGEEIPEGTIDDAIKNVITLRLVGRRQ